MTQSQLASQTAMSRTVTSPEQFITIGENIHTTRVVRRNGRRATTLPGGVEAVVYKDETGAERHLTVPRSTSHVLSPTSRAT